MSDIIKPEASSEEIEKASLSPAKKIIRIASNVVLYTFIAICVLAVVLVLTGKKEDGATTVLNHQMRVVISESMAKNPGKDVSGYKIGSIPLKAMVFIERVPDDPEKAASWYSSVEVGDVLTFTYYTNEVITHRVVEIEEVEGGYKFFLEGDNSSAEYGGMQQVIDTSKPHGTTLEYVIGKVVHVSPVLGWIVYTIGEPIGMIFLVIVPCLIIIVIEIVRIANLVHREKKKKLTDERKKQDDRIAELEKMLEEMKAAKDNDTAPPSES